MKNYVVLLSLIGPTLINGEFLNNEDFANAKYVDINAPPTFALNDQRFITKVKMILSKNILTQLLEGRIILPGTGRCAALYEHLWDSKEEVSRKDLLSTTTTFGVTDYSKNLKKFDKDDRTSKELRKNNFLDQHDYQVIKCYADFGHVGGRQEVSLTDQCMQYSTVIHEFMHVLGFIHEHQRQDRDNYIDVLWTNIIPAAALDFAKIDPQESSYYGEPYDYFSIMHYESKEGSKNGGNTLLAKYRWRAFTPYMGKSRDFTVSDINRINKAYNCVKASRTLIRRNI